MLVLSFSVQYRNRNRTLKLSRFQFDDLNTVLVTSVFVIVFKSVCDCFQSISIGFKSCYELFHVFITKHNTDVDHGSTQPMSC